MRSTLCLSIVEVWIASLVTVALHSQATLPQAPAPVPAVAGPVLTALPPAIASPQRAANTAAVSASYVGSRACQKCHPVTYERWSHTRMANIITDPKINPRAVLGDFSQPNPLGTFALEDVAFIYGTKWKQRYFLRKGNDYYPAAAQWDVTNRVWRP